MARKKIKKNPNHSNSKYVYALLCIAALWATYVTCFVDGTFDPPGTFDVAKYRLRIAITGVADDVNSDIKRRNREASGIVNERDELNKKRVERDTQ